MREVEFVKNTKAGRNSGDRVRFDDVSAAAIVKRGDAKFVTDGPVAQVVESGGDRARAINAAKADAEKDKTADPAAADGEVK